jgi:hypothetical protein
VASEEKKGAAAGATAPYSDRPHGWHRRIDHLRSQCRGAAGVPGALTDSLDMCPVSHRDDRATEPPQFLFLVRGFYFGGTGCGVSGNGATAFGRVSPVMGGSMSGGQMVPVV